MMHKVVEPHGRAIELNLRLPYAVNLEFQLLVEADLAMVQRRLWSHRPGRHGPKPHPQRRRPRLQRHRL